MRAGESADLFAPERPACPVPLKTVAPPRAVLPAAAAQTLSAELWLGVQVAAGAAQPGQEPSSALMRLATYAQRLTPRVALAPPDGLLLEVKGSLHLFGGVDGLRGEMDTACAHCGLRGTLALAPTPLAALIAARAGQPLVVLDSAQLIGQLAPLPLTALRWPPKLLDRLAYIGVRTIGQALRLPRAGFAQRFGAGQLKDLDRLTGHAGDPRERFEARVRFRRRRELSFELESRTALLAALGPLLAELERFLEARQCGVLELECRLWHRGHPPSRSTVRLAAPLADAARLAELLGERLGTLSLPAPVRACELRSGFPVPRVASSGTLWQPGEQGGSPEAGSPQLIERLRARLGSEAVHGLVCVQDHRPEAAWRAAEPGARSGEGSGGCRGAARPLWLLPAPRRLSERDGLPRYRGGLRLASEPERIETGWWDGAEGARDYYSALDTHGRRLWLFRERNRPHHWFLHGVFG
jgi:protein ImuB